VVVALSDCKIAVMEPSIAIMLGMVVAAGFIILILVARRRNAEHVRKRPFIDALMEAAKAGRFDQDY
jgi:hypothetical protein